MGRKQIQIVLSEGNGMTRDNGSRCELNKESVPNPFLVGYDFITTTVQKQTADDGKLVSTSFHYCSLHCSLATLTSYSSRFGIMSCVFLRQAAALDVCYATIGRRAFSLDPRQSSLSHLRDPLFRDRFSPINENPTNRHQSNVDWMECQRRNTACRFSIICMAGANG